jgi:CRISPR-associated endonuclease/helicase Cas3
MTFYSHSKESEKNQKIGSKTIAIHIKGTIEKANYNFSETIDFDVDIIYLKELLNTIVRFHDLGKYTSFFQNYLLDKGKIDNDKKRHSLLGALSAYNYFDERNEKLALIALIVIYLHHGNLIDISLFPQKIDDHINRIFEIQKQDIEKIIPLIEKEISISALKNIIFYPDERKIRRGLKIWCKRDQNIQDYFLINYFFSLLLEADKLDASDTDIYKLKPINSNLVDDRFGYAKFDSNKNLKDLSNNELRNFCRTEVVANLYNERILNYFLFTLTAPTGIGKTMIALDFALKLKSKIRKELNIESRIIYALPFINIIEQALSEYQKTLPKNIEILGHYQFADVFGKENEDLNYENSELKNYNQKLMSLDTWQADVVITSFVQFFETLIGNRNKLLKKFNHFANSIIILDEVQTLRLDQMPLIGASLYYLSKFLKARIILMTATKPKIFDLAQEHILNNENERVEAKELLTSFKSIFSVFERTKIIPLLHIEFSKDNFFDDFITNVFSKKWDTNKSCLIVCNTVNRSIELFNAIKKFIEQNEFQNEIKYLSTNILPAHRFNRIEKIKELIKQHKAPILISTQVVEAGVDLDFDMGFRDVGPIDSIIQVAGRINRNNNPEKANSPLYIVDFKDCEKIYGSLTSFQAKSALSSKNEFSEKEYLTLITNYFDTISQRSSFDRYNKIFESMKALRYDSDDKEIMPVSSFKIIDEAKTTSSVFIEISEEEVVLKNKYLEKIKNLISKEDFEKHYKQDFQQRIIAIPSYLTKDLMPINEFEVNILIVPYEQISTFYDNETGFIRKQTTTTHFL